MAVVVTAEAAPGADLAVAAVIAAAASEVVPTEDIAAGIMGPIFMALIFGDTGAAVAVALDRCCS